MPKNENSQSSSNANNATTSSRGNNSLHNGYTALRNSKGSNQNSDNSNNSNKKAAKVAAKAAANHFAGPVGGKAVDALANTKLGNNVLNKGGQLLNKIPGMSKATNKLDNSGALDMADKALSAKGASNQAVENNSMSKAQSTDTGSGSASKKKSFLSGERDTEVEGNADANFSTEITGQMFFSQKTIPIAIIGVVVLLIFCMFGVVISIGSADNEEASAHAKDSDYLGNPDLEKSKGTKYEAKWNNGSGPSCVLTSNPDSSTKKSARLTTYTGSSLGGSIGDVSAYVKEGTIYYDKGYAMWKGGTRSKSNGKVYGEVGTDYMIVATATKYIVGNCVTKDCSYRFSENNRVAYFEYGDTFTIEVSFNGGKSYNSYNAIVLDSCGACMEWSLTANGIYAPNNTNQYELSKCRQSEGYKIDLFRRAKNVAGKADMGYFLQGNSSNTCVGEVDLGDLVVGLSDTQLLINKTMKELYGESGLKDLEKQISDNATKYGAGTGKGAAAAAITLINSLKK